MKKLVLLFLACWLVACSTQRPEKRILVYCAAETWAKAETQRSFDLIQAACESQAILWDSSFQANHLHEDSLAAYSAMVILSTDLASMSPFQQASLRRYTEGGGGILLLDCQLHTPYQWPWMEACLDPTAGEDIEGSDIRLKNLAGGHLAFDMPAFEKADPDQQSSGIGTSLQKIIQDNTWKPDQMRSPRGPEESRFTKVVLSEGLYEPMELDILPDGKVIFVERRGDIKLYDPETNQTELIYRMDVCIDGNYEDGILGLALDPDFAQNNYLYLYYSPPCDTPSQFLSRFRLDQGKEFLRESEVVVLKVPVQRETCCHSGGAVQFGPDGYLYLSTGDNTSSKASDGYSPLDERPGRSPYDAQKSSGNTHDLRGKILRIDVSKFGDYRIPPGNLFPADGSQGRPEVYVMGARNPFRISIDPKTNYLYWGDVGPDSGVDSPKYGPQSYDEWNQARTAGNYGWPYFVGDNKAFRSRNFATDETGDFFDPEHPVNHSPYNTGATHLPPARGAFIWYPYGESKEFPALGKGSRSSMAGPVYYQDYWQKWPDSEVAFPDYYNGKMFIYEWARSWIKVLSFDAEGMLSQIEPFLPEEEFIKPIDVEFGPDGALYVLEYGENYFAKNDKARLSRIAYHAGNRAPIAHISSSTLVGAAPLKVTFSASKSRDPDPQDKLSYTWQIHGQTFHGPEVSFTFEQPGKYTPILILEDGAGGLTEISQDLWVGNAAPEVNISLEGNQSFYKGSAPRSYQIQVTDLEDGGSADGSISASEITTDLTYLDGEIEWQKLNLKELGARQYLKGKLLLEASDCQSCHAIRDSSIGPSFQAVARRYRDDYQAVVFLAAKVINGGGGNWGDQYMAAHPQHSTEEAEDMVKYILSLTESNKQASGLALEGALALNKHLNSPGGNYLLTASYKDKGAHGMPALSGFAQQVLRPLKLGAETCDRYHLAVRKRGGRDGDDSRDVRKTVHGSWIAFDGLDLSGMSQLELAYYPERAGSVRLLLDSPQGQEIGNLAISGWQKDLQNQRIKLPEIEGIHDLYIIFDHPESPSAGLIRLDWIEFIPEPNP